MAWIEPRSQNVRQPKESDSIGISRRKFSKTCKVVATVPVNPITEIISLRNLGIAELPLQKLYVAVAIDSAWQRIHLLLIVATQRLQEWIVSMKSGSSDFQPTGNCSLQITAADVSAPIPVIQLPLYLKQEVEQPVTRFGISSSSRHDPQPMSSES